MAQIDINQDISKMPDCLKKYQIIVARAQQRNEKYTDNKFRAVDSSIGSTLVSNVYTGPVNWLRMSGPEEEDQDYAIFKDGVTIDDVEQGHLGDCYFLSALSLLDEQDLRQSFVFVNDEHEWKQCGAFCIKFWEAGKPDYVIVDDIYPFNDDGRLLPFARCHDKTEIWCPIIEKAYAKKFGSYENIEGGLVHTALNELLNGFPDSIKCVDTNVGQLFLRIMGLY